MVLGDGSLVAWEYARTQKFAEIIGYAQARLEGAASSLDGWGTDPKEVAAELRQAAVEIERRFRAANAGQEATQAAAPGEEADR